MAGNPDQPGLTQVPESDRRPFFSVLITAFNRENEIERCVRSCTDQTFQNFEIVVVNDASTDATATVLAAIDEPRLRIVTHSSNRGISPARATTIEHARGEWLVQLDSDWELLPHSLSRLKELIEQRPPDVRIIRSLLRWDDGTVSPSVLPAERVTDYGGRLRWLEAVALQGGGSDAGHCIHRAVFEAGNYPSDRRGVIEVLWETNVARHERSLWVDEVLGLQHVGAANSATRDVSIARMVPRLLREAPDLRWMAETMLADHGSELAREAPHYRAWLLKSAALESFLAGDRRAGVRHTLEARRSVAIGKQEWATLMLGLLHRRALAYVKLAGRRWRAWRDRDRAPGEPAIVR
jgi:hypothetical protein